MDRAGRPDSHFDQVTRHGLLRGKLVPILGRFCLWIALGAPGYEMGGTFDHGPGTGTEAFEDGQGGSCSGVFCPANWIWTSSDGTGRFVWNFTTYGTIEARG